MSRQAKCQDIVTTQITTLMINAESKRHKLFVNPIRCNRSFKNFTEFYQKQFEMF